MTENKLIEFLNRQLVFGDGAMGTMLYTKGVFINTCFEELNISRPQLVGQIHDLYISAGSDFIETNTFGANEFRLARFGLAEKTVQINTSAVKIAKQSAVGKALVAGAVGPLGIDIAAGGRIQYVTELRSTLEDVYLKLIREAQSQ